jgi:NAD(P)H-hydrate epimerase
VSSTDKEAALLLERADIIFDGMIGTGLKGALRAGDTRDFILLVNGIKHAKKVAIDLPSGLSEQAGKSAVFFHADITVTFGLPKILFYYPHIRLHCGEIHIVNPGYPKWLLQEYGAQRSLLGIDQVSCRNIHVDSYKNSKGHLGVFAGSEGFTGAASLASEAALRVHTGLVSLYVDDNIYTVLSSQLRSVMVKPLHGQVISRDELKARYSALLVGPGWGGLDGREQQLREIVMSGLPVLLDADAITLLRQLLEQDAVDREKFNNVVLTPHPGEFFRLSGIRVSDEPQSVIDAVKKVSHELGCVIVYKSYINYIVEPDGTITVMEGMNPAMGSAGSGDVLSGIIGGFLAQRYCLADAAVTGNAVHQRAGRLAKESRGWFVAEDLLGFLGNVC